MSLESEGGERRVTLRCTNVKIKAMARNDLVMSTNSIEEVFNFQNLISL